MDAITQAGATTKIDVVPVDGLRSFMAFCRLPREIYAGRPGFAPSLDVERWTLFGSKLNPHFRLVEHQAFLALRNGAPAGRILAQVYKPGEPDPVGASRAQFGCLDAVEDEAVVAALTHSAGRWLKARGAVTAHGPFSPSIWGEAGLLVEGFEEKPMVFSPWNPPYLGPMLERLGYAKARDLVSYSYAVTEKDRAAKPTIVNRPEWRDRLKIRNFDMKNLKAEAAIIVDLFNDAWAENWGFVPFTVEEFMSSADALRFIMPPEGGFMIELDGEPQSFAIVLPNLHEITGDLGGRLFPANLPRLLSRVRRHRFASGRLLLFGLRRALQRKAVGGAVILAFIEEIRRRSSGSAYQEVEFGWVLEDNLGMRRPIELAGGRLAKIHRVYEKDLAG